MLWYSQKISTKLPQKAEELLFRAERARKEIKGETEQSELNRLVIK